MRQTRLLLVSFLLLAGGFASARAARDPQGRFSDQDRKAAQDYHDQHKAKPAPGFRSQDKLSDKDQDRIREGAVLDADLRKRSHPIPADLLHRLPPAPKGHHYVVIGGQVCDVDSGWHISDVIHINLTL
jgi:hypothetical protein